MSQDDQDLQLLRAITGGSQSVTINGNAASLIVSVVAVFAITVAVAAVIVVAVMRSADVRDMSQLRADVRELKQYRQQHSDRIEKLENANGPK